MKSIEGAFLLFTIRSETVHDYAAIAAVHAETFTYSMNAGESLLVAALRARQDYDPELSLVAEREGRIVGHVLFTPMDVVIRGVHLRAVALAPAAVLAEAQRQGAGKALIREGLARAQKRGYACSLLLGHPDYYAKFGYQPRMWGRRSVQVPADSIPALPEHVKARRIRPDDTGGLSAIWTDWHADASLTVLPGDTLTGWMSPAASAVSYAVELDGRLAGYYRCNAVRREVYACAAADRESFDAICALLANAFGLQSGGALQLPSSPRLLGLIGGTVEEDICIGPEQMLAVLDHHCEALADYCAGVSSGSIIPGHVHWPVEFDVLS